MFKTFTLAAQKRLQQDKIGGRETNKRPKVLHDMMMT